MHIETSLIATDNSVADKQRLAKLTDGAHQFEAMMLEQMLKPLNFGGSPDDAGTDPASGAGATIQGFGTEALSKAIVKGGGFGLARQIVRQVTSEDAAHRAQAATQNKGGKV